MIDYQVKPISPNIFVGECSVFLTKETANFSPDQKLVYYNCSGDDYTSNSIYQNNLEAMLSDLCRNNDMNYGFDDLSLGEGNNTVNAIALCRGILISLHASNVGLPL